MNVAEICHQKLMPADEAVRVIESRDRVYLGGGAGVPQVLERAMVDRAGELRNVEVVHVLTFAGGEYLHPKYKDSFRHRALFIGANARQAVWEGGSLQTDEKHFIMEKSSPVFYSAQSAYTNSSMIML